MMMMEGKKQLLSLSLETVFFFAHSQTQPIRQQPGPKRHLLEPPLAVLAAIPDPPAVACAAPVDALPRGTVRRAGPGHGGGFRVEHEVQHDEDPQVRGGDAPPGRRPGARVHPTEIPHGGAPKVCLVLKGEAAAPPLPSRERGKIKRAVTFCALRCRTCDARGRGGQLFGSIRTCGAAWKEDRKLCWKQSGRYEK